MSSLKEKFDDFREEPQHTTWKHLLKRLNAEMPVRSRRKYLLWLLPVLFVGTIGAWFVFSNNRSQPLVVRNQNKIESTGKNDQRNNKPGPNIKDKETSTAHANSSSNATIHISPPAPDQYQVSQPSIPVNPTNPNPQIIPNNNEGNNIATAGQDLINDTSQTSESISSPSVNNTPALNTINSRPMDFRKPKEIKPLDLTPLVLNPTIKPIDKNGANKFLLEIYFAGGGSNIILKDPLLKSSINNFTIENNKNLRNGISKMGFSYTTGFGLKMDLVPNIRIKTGFYITQVSQTLYYNSSPAQCHCGDSLSLGQLAHLNPSDMINSGDSISLGNSNSFTNKYFLREIPLIFEYMVPTTKYKNLSYVLSLGVSYMYMKGINTRIPDADNVGFLPIIDKTNDPSIFPSYTSAVNAIAGFGLIYKAAYNVEWSLAPQFKMAVTSLSKNDHWFREYPWQMQLAIGVGKRF